MSSVPEIFLSELLTELAGEGGLFVLILAVYVSGVLGSGVQRPFLDAARLSAPGVEALLFMIGGVGVTALKLDLIG